MIIFAHASSDVLASTTSGTDARESLSPRA
jgi:hypothetical protein